MKNKLLLLTLFFLSNLTFAQNKPNEKVAAEFENNYNSNQFETIFESFSQDMKEALPLDQTVQFLSGLKLQVGRITEREFVAIQHQSYASYKTTFEKGILSVNISVDENGDVNGLFIQPFKEIDKEEVSAVNALINLPKNQSDILFNHTQQFPNHTQVSIALIENGFPTFYGITKENDSIKFTNNKDKVFEIGSISKVFTATLLANAWINKKIKEDETINSFYNFPFKNNIEISFKSLANHTSGLDRLPSNLGEENPENPYKTYDEAKLNSYLKNDLKRNHKTGEKYAYSNLGAGLLGFTLGKMEKSNYEHLLTKQLFKKYQMNSSTTQRTNIEDKLVIGLNSEGNEVSNWDFDTLAGAGGIFSTVDDLSKFILAHFNPKNKELEWTRKPTFRVSDAMEIGLGWHILTDESGDVIYWHNGGTGGYSSSITMDTNLKNAVIILSNVSAFNPSADNINQLSFELLKTLERK